MYHKKIFIVATVLMICFSLYITLSYCLNGRASGFYDVSLSREKAVAMIRKKLKEAGFYFDIHETQDAARITVLRSSTNDWVTAEIILSNSENSKIVLIDKLYHINSPDSHEDEKRNIMKIVREAFKRDYDVYVHGIFLI